MNLAKEESHLKHKMVHELTKSIKKEPNRASAQISESTVSLGKSIEDGLVALDFALSGSQQQEDTSNVSQI